MTTTNMDYSPMITLISNIVNGNYENDQYNFTDAHKQVLQVWLDNADDLDGERDLFKTLSVIDLYYQADITIETDNGDYEVLKPIDDLVEMIYGNVDDEVNA